jgi:hypothetical protein
MMRRPSTAATCSWARRRWFSSVRNISATVTTAHGFDEFFGNLYYAVGKRNVARRADRISCGRIFDAGRIALTYLDSSIERYGTSLTSNGLFNFRATV